MRTPRIRLDGPCHFHCMSRIINREFLLDDVEKEMFRKLMRRVEAFTGCTVLTYAIMNNHFHILLAENPMEGELSDEAFLARCGELYQGKGWSLFLSEYRRCLETDSPAEMRRFKQRYIKRMHNVSEFMQTLLSRFSQWYNRVHGRRGPLWCERFKSVLVEGKRDVLTSMAAYIDLNPLRAGIVEDPIKYRWCGLGEAVAGGRSARCGLMQIVESGPVSNAPIGELLARWTLTLGAYRSQLAICGKESTGDGNVLVAAGFTPAKIAAILSAGGKIPLAQALRCKLVYFTEGVILGSVSFLMEHQAAWATPLKRKIDRPPQHMKEIDLDDLVVGRAWRSHQVQLPGG